jgi:hypothetical protein
MTSNADEVEKVFSGNLIEVEAYQQVLADAGIESKVVGTELTASFGTALQGSVELWVHRNDVEKAAAAIRRDEEQRGRKERAEKHPHPTDEPRPVG